MAASKIAFRVFAVLAFAFLGVTSVFAWKEIQRERLEHEGSHVPPGAEVKEFSFTERSGATVEKKDLLGKVWIAGFIFTSCAGPCPKLSTEMARLQEELAKSDVRMVSFSVDPDRDTPEALAEYANRYKADKSKWLFLTGKKETMHSFIGDSFKLAVSEDNGENRMFGMEIAHSSKLVLIGRDGKILGYYGGTDPVALDSLRARAEKLAAQNP